MGNSTFILTAFQNCGCRSIPSLSKRNYMGYEVKKTEHLGAKKGCGAYWGRKADAKKQSNHKRRKQDRILTNETEVQAF
jgi:hypothetical protein